MRPVVGLAVDVFVCIWIMAFLRGHEGGRDTHSDKQAQLKFKGRVSVSVCVRGVQFVCVSVCVMHSAQ